VTGPRRIPLAVAIRREDVLHFLGYPDGRRPAARLDARLDELIDEARGLAEPRGAWRRLPPEDAAGIGLESVLAEALVIGLVTVGDGIERRATQLLESGDPVAALLLDAAGSAAVEEAADRLGALIAAGDAEGEAAPDGEAPPVGCRVSPGYGRWALESQRPLLALLPHRELGVRLLPSLLMVPRKSISFAMWLGADARPLTGLSGCARCPLDTCRYRRAPRRGGSVS
jgi:hypothetical protein